MEIDRYSTLNVPQEISDSLLDWYTSFKVTKCYSTNFFDTYDIKEQEYDKLEVFPKGWYKASWFVMKPGALHSPHLDRTRYCALNLPILVDIDKSYTLVGNRQTVDDHTREPAGYEYDVKVPLLGAQGTFVNNHDEYDRYPMNQAVLLNTKWPHGAYNGSSTSRVIMTFGFTRTYEDVKNDLVEMGWLDQSF